MDVTWTWHQRRIVRGAFLWYGIGKLTPSLIQSGSQKPQLCAIACT